MSKIFGKKLLDIQKHKERLRLKLINQFLEIVSDQLRLFTATDD